jgi:hypothetical protein
LLLHHCMSVYQLYIGRDKYRHLSGASRSIICRCRGQRYCMRLLILPSAW